MRSRPRSRRPRPAASHRADRWAHVSEKLSVVGISPKSFGRTLKGGGTDEGRKYLGIGTEFEGWYSLDRVFALPSGTLSLYVRR